MSSRAQPPPSLRRRLGFLLWTVVASLLLLEVALQVGSLFLKEEPPDVRADVDPSAVRILAVGDSWVAGAEAPEGQGFVDHLGRELDQLTDGRRVQLFNLGRTGANSAHVALTVLDEAPRIQPALIVVLIGQNNASNFYRVAEVEERVGAGTPRRRLSDRSRVVKLARILLANARGSSGYDEATGGDPRVEIPALALDDEGMPIVDDPYLTSVPGRLYLRRQLIGGPPLTGDAVSDAAWRVLFATAQRDLDAATAQLTALSSDLGWPAPDSSPSAPTARDSGELLARYAAARLARQQRRWPAVRHHAGAAVGFEPRGALSDLAAAEAHLLAGDWRSSRDLLVSAHNRAPGLLDTIDLAARFPDQARNPDVYEALEFPPAAPMPPAYEESDVRRYAQFDAEGAVEPTMRWLEEHPDDGPLRVDLAVWLLEHGRHDEADELMGLPAGAPVSPPPDADLDSWRFAVARALSTGGRAEAITTATDALERTTPDAPLLGVIAETLSAHGDCDRLSEVADAWYRARGDAGGYVRVLAPCVEPAAAAAQLASLRAGWGPLGSEAAWGALVRAGHKPFELLYRDLDLVLSEGQTLGADVLLLNYPNPSEDHTALREILADYAASRPIGYVDLWADFRARHDDEAWAERLGPNGHCNAAGYREMADGILAWLRDEGTLVEVASEQ